MLGNLPGQAKTLTVVRPDLLAAAVRAMQARGDSGGDAAFTSDADEPTADGGATYHRLVADLIHELRVFTGCNWVLFALTTLMAGWRRQDTPHLLAAAGILAATTCVAAAAYLTAQDWFWTFLTGDYVGCWYLVPMGTVAALLTDVAYNRSRVSSRLLRAAWYWPG